VSMSRFSFFKKQYSPGLPELPEAVNDNMYLAAASKAGELDKSSGAYDHFLFEENAVNGMPFERAVDSHMNLVSIRLEDTGRRELLERQRATFSGRAAVAKAEAAIERESMKIEYLKQDALAQEAILSGTSTGRHGLRWIGASPQLTTMFNSFFKLLSPYLVFALVGLVDVSIVWLSLVKIPGFTGIEAGFFTAPVVGIQLVFPHFIGQRLAFQSRGIEQKLRNNIEIIVLTLIWLIFAATLTEIRMNFIFSMADQAGQAISPFPLGVSLYFANFLMLVGLGAWLMLLESKRNPHEHDLMRILLQIQRHESKINKANQKLLTAKSALPSLELAESVATSSYEDAVRASGAALAEAAKAVYRRSLVNQIGSPEFTSSYLGKSNSAGRVSRNVST